MVKKSEIARGVRVVLNSNFQINSLSDKYLACEPIIFICDNHVYNSIMGEYVHVRGGSYTTSGIVYLNQIDLEFPISDKPFYSFEDVDYNKDISHFKNNL